jgi:tripartite-type tricarboxylate transporter receptor subunit TctC
VKLLKLPDVKDRLAGAGFESIGNTPEQFAAYIRSEIEKWAQVVKASGARAD